MSVDMIRRERFGLKEAIITQTRAQYFSLDRDWRRRRHSTSGGGSLKQQGPRQMGMGERGPGRRRKANMNSKLLLRKRNGGLHFLAAEGRWATLILLFAINFSTTCLPLNLPPNMPQESRPDSNSSALHARTLGQQCPSPLPAKRAKIIHFALSKDCSPH